MANDREFAIIGLGRFGSHVATTLYAMGYSILGIDSNEDKVQKNRDNCTHVVQADATDEETLRSLGISNFDVAVVSIGDDLEASVLVALLLKELGVAEVIAKASSEVHGKVLKRIGADRVVFPEKDMGIRLANHLAIDNIVDYLEITPNVSIVEVSVSPEMTGKTLRELDLRAKHGINVLAIRQGQEVNVSPDAERPLASEDILIALGSNENVRRWQMTGS